MFTVNKNPSAKDVASFGWVMLGGFGVIGALLWYVALLPKGGWTPAAGWGWNGAGRHVAALVLWALAVLSLIVCRGWPPAGRGYYVVWMTGAMYIGTVVTTVLLTVLFFVLLPLFSLIRLADPLRLKWNRQESYWEKPSPHEATLERIRRPF
jgi:hypothetical protein